MVNLEACRASCRHLSIAQGSSKEDFALFFMDIVTADGKVKMLCFHRVGSQRGVLERSQSGPNIVHFVSGSNCFTTCSSLSDDCKM